jgi:starch synthase
VIPFDATNPDTANGFGFITPTPNDLFTATWLGILNYRNGEVWRQLQTNGMAADFSWDRSAAEYEAIYHRAAAS